MIELSLYYRRKHNLFILILAPIAISIAAMFLWFINDVYGQIGVVVGIITGIVVGTRIYMRFMHDYKCLSLD